MVINRLVIWRNHIIHNNLFRQNSNIRFISTKQLKSPIPIKIENELKSKLTNVILPKPTRNFTILCLLTGTVIACSSLIFLKEKLLFGTIGGVTAKTATAPLERLTVFRQASVDYKSSLIPIFRSILKEEGVAGLWRGNGINVFRASIQKGSLFALNDCFRDLLTNKEQQKLNDSLLLSFISGLLAGLTSTLITFPLDTVKTVNQATIHTKQWPAITVWYSLVQKKGLFRGPWCCGLPTAIGASIYYGIKFMAFDACIMGVALVSDRLDDFEIQKDIKNAVAGLGAGIIGNAVTYPNNCIRKRMQTAHVCDVIGVKSVFQPNNYIQTMQQFYTNEGGIRRFYKGFGINLLRNAPNTAIQFVVYKRLQSLWNETYQN